MQVREVRSKYIYVCPVPLATVKHGSTSQAKKQATQAYWYTHTKQTHRYRNTEHDLWML